MMEFCSSSTLAAMAASVLAIYFGGLAVTCFFKGEQ
jgi:hypothetical protein